MDPIESTPRVPLEADRILAEDRFLHFLAVGLVRPGADADDAIQHAWLRILEHPPRRRGAVRSFLAAVLRNRLRESARADRRRSRHERAAARAEAVPSAAEMAGQEELRRRVGEAVLALEEPYRTTIWLRFREQLPPREVARRMDAPVETVRTRTRRALDELRQRLDRLYGDRQTWVLAMTPLLGTLREAAGTTLAWGGTFTGVWVSKTVVGGFAATLVLCVGLAVLVSMRAAGDAGAGGVPRSAGPQAPSSGSSSEEIRRAGVTGVPPGGSGAVGSRTASRRGRGIGSAPRSETGTDDPRRESTALLPASLLPLPAGRVTVGVPAAKLLEIAVQTQPHNAGARVTTLKNSISELGTRSADIEGFLLGQFPVTNAEYRVFVEATGHRFPFHWWRDGRPDDYQRRMREIRQQLPGAGAVAPILYWERNHAELPWALKDPDGADIGSLPVTFVSRDDAVVYAAWAGMRLPTEEEWTYAARGAGNATWIWAVNGASSVGDRYDPAVLGDLRLHRARDQVLKPVGATGEAAVGAFGHGDLVAQVWEWTASAFGPLAGMDPFEREFARLKTDPLYRELPASQARENLTYAPRWAEDEFVIKGGSYASGRDAVQLHIDVRHRLPPAETTSLIGFRVAKSPEPGRDAARAAIRNGFNGSLVPGRAPDLEDQIGIERYDLDESGRIAGYHTVSLVPMDGLPTAVSTRSPGLAERLDGAVAVAVLWTTEALRRPRLDPGLYTIEYRAGTGPGGVETLRFDPGDLEVPAAQPQFLFRDQRGRYRAAMPMSAALQLPEAYAGASLSVGAPGAGLGFVFGLPLAGHDDRHVVFEVSLALTALVDSSWRSPERAAAAPTSRAGEPEGASRRGPDRSIVEVREADPPRSSGALAPARRRLLDRQETTALNQLARTWFRHWLDRERAHDTTAHRRAADAARAAREAFRTGWETAQGRGDLLASVADLRAIFSGVFSGDIDHRGASRVVELPASEDDPAYDRRVPRSYDPRVPRRTVVVVRGPDVHREPHEAAREYLAYTWQRRSPFVENSVFVLPRLTGAPPDARLDLAEGIVPLELMRELFMPLAAAQRDLHLDRQRMILDCGRDTSGFGLWLASSFPDRFAALILRWPVDVPDLRLGSLEGVPVLVITQDETRAAGNRLVQQLGRSAKRIDGMGGYPYPDIQPAVEAWLEDLRRSANRPRIVLEPNFDGYLRRSWIRILVPDSPMPVAPQDRPRVVAVADWNRNRIEITTTGVRELELLLNDILVDLDRPFTVSVNGIEQRHQKTRSFDVLVETLFERFDPTWIFTARLRVTVPER